VSEKAIAGEEAGQKAPLPENTEAVCGLLRHVYFYDRAVNDLRKGIT